jgi:hypothetical protein
MVLITEQKHRSAVTNYLVGKVREFAYQLRVVVVACDRGLVAFQDRQLGASDADVVYGFSAFANAMQALKETIGGPYLTWAQISQLPHGCSSRRTQWQARGARRQSDCGGDVQGTGTTA